MVLPDEAAASRARGCKERTTEPRRRRAQSAIRRRVVEKRKGLRVSHKQARLWETHNQPKSHARTLAIKLPYALLDRQSSTAGHRSHVSICWRLTTGFRCRSVTRQPARRAGVGRPGVRRWITRLE